MFSEETKKVVVYSYDNQGVYQHSFEYLWVVGTGLAPNSTLNKPPNDKQGFACVWVDEKWEYKENHIGKTIYSIADKTAKVVKNIGKIEKGYTLLAPSQFDTWSGTVWEDTRTEQEKLEYKRSQYQKLTRYQFLRCLLENGYKASAIEAQILTIEDEFTRELTLLGFKEATNFIRNDESIIAMQSILNLSDEQVDQMWEQALIQ
ncbi:hypothetical protein B9T25_12920 [Acinetobacter sp. ANC 4470]|uniref:hypothetical protein n=1 Tax=Acinetobacter sp. ANC 4470 TaxID=1977881 RepID=UPI000A346DCC|nr:hypothetical protein [Acinetobacter sp. ANC 4470]OTG64336.1 hypothetical protein B9T25_12920 [Acinetobacter sp. ANC 4470]